jgi:hypothetical protein
LLSSWLTRSTSAELSCLDTSVDVIDPDLVMMG